MDRYVVYKHTAPSNKVYIGITKQEDPRRRWKYGHGYTHNSHFHNAIMKYGWDNIKHQILASDLSLEDASAIEKELIATYIQQGLCYNIAEGGQDGNKRKRTEEEKQHLSAHFKEYYKTHRHPLQGKQFSSDSKEKLRESQKKRWIDNYALMYNTVIVKKEVGVYNILTKAYKEFSSEKEAAIALKIAETTFRRHVDDGRIFNNLVIFPLNELTFEEALQRAYLREIIGPHRGGRELEVVQLNLNGDYIQTYSSAKQASEETGTNITGIGKACRGDAKHSGGFFWLYKSEYLKHKEDGSLDALLDEKKERLHQRKEICITPIMQLTIDGSNVQAFKSGCDIHRKLGFDSSIISKCCKGKLSKAYGYKWKFITKEEYEIYARDLAA